MTGYNAEVFTQTQIAIDQGDVDFIAEIAGIALLAEIERPDDAKMQYACDAASFVS